MRGARCSTQRARCTVQRAPRATQPPTPNRRRWPRRARGRCRSAVGAHRRPCTSPLTVSVPVSIAGLFPSTMSGSVHCICDAPGISTRNCAHGYQLSRHIGTILMKYRRHDHSRCPAPSTAALTAESAHSAVRALARLRALHRCMPGFPPYGRCPLRAPARGEPSPEADVAAERQVPVQMWPGCAPSPDADGRWGGGGPGPGADVAGVSPVPVQMWQGRAQSPRSLAGVSPVPVKMWESAVGPAWSTASTVGSEALSGSTRPIMA